MAQADQDKSNDQSRKEAREEDRETTERARSGAKDAADRRKAELSKKAERNARSTAASEKRDVGGRDRVTPETKTDTSSADAEAKRQAAAAKLAADAQKAAERKAVMDKIMADLNVAVQRSTAMADTAMGNWQQAVATRTDLFDKYDAERQAYKTKQGTTDQMAAMAQMRDMSQGKGTSAAQSMLAMEQAKAQRQQLAMATARGGANISAIRGAGMAAAAQQGDIAGQAASLRAQEQQAALQAYAAQANEVERQRMSGENMYLNAAMQGMELGNNYALQSGNQAQAMGQQDFSQRYAAGMIPVQDILTNEQMTQQVNLAKIQSDAAMKLQNDAQQYQTDNYMKNLIMGGVQGAAGALFKIK
jgi:colicin import membrane protein